jgi:hypothetical protein
MPCGTGECCTHHCSGLNGAGTCCIATQEACNPSVGACCKGSCQSINFQYICCVSPGLRCTQNVDCCSGRCNLWDGTGYICS